MKEKDGRNQSPTGLHNTISHAQKSPKSDYSVERFVSENYELLTVLSLFAAVSVYLTQISERATDEIRLGIAGCWVIFSILLFVVMGNGIDYALFSLYEEKWGEFGLHILLFLGLTSLATSVIATASRYSEEIAPMLDLSVVIVMLLFYLSYLSDQFWGNERSNRIEWVLDTTPYSSALLLGVLLHNGESEIFQVSPGKMYASAFALAIGHFVFMWILILCINAAVQIYIRLTRLRESGQKMLEDLELQ